MKLPTIMTADGRRAWAFVALWIGCGVFTALAAAGAWLVKGEPKYTLILALAAHVQLFVGMSAFAFLLGRRMALSVSREGLTMDDRKPGPHLPPPVASAPAGASE